LDDLFFLFLLVLELKRISRSASLPGRREEEFHVLALWDNESNLLIVSDR
jgi:hypothetical protein